MASQCNIPTMSGVGCNIPCEEMDPGDCWGAVWLHSQCSLKCQLQL